MKKVVIAGSESAGLTAAPYTEKYISPNPDEPEPNGKSNLKRLHYGD